MRCKSLRTSIFIVLMSVLSVIGAWIFQTNNTITYASSAVVVDGEENSYLYDNQKGYCSNISAGSVTGYGQYLLGEEVTLTANAKTGYYVVGWRIEYNGNVIFLNNNENIENVDITLTNEDKNEDTYNEYSELKISQVFADLEIAPVYDYIYYDFDVSEWVDYILPSESVSVGSVTLYYNSLDNSTSETKYSNVILYNGSNYYYFNEIYCDGTTYYTKHLRQLDEEVYDKVALNIGAYRLNDVVDFEVIVLEGKYIDIKNATVVANEKTLDVENLIVNKHQSTYTTDFSFEFIIQDDKSQINKLNIEFEKYYTVDINFGLVERYINAIEENETYYEVYKKNEEYYTIINNKKVVIKNLGSFSNENPVVETLDSASLNGLYNTLIEKELIEISGTVGDFLKLNNYTYLTKGDLTIVCSDYDEIVGVKAYSYYEFNMLNNNEKISIDKDCSIDIDYMPSYYTVEYMATTEDNGEWINRTDLNKINTKYYLRGSEITLPVNPIDNVGYTFSHYTIDKENTITSITIDKTTPSSQLVFICYDKINYSVKFVDVNYDKILNTNIHPISNLITSVNGVENSNITDFSITNDIATINIDDELGLNIKLNDGFLLNGIKCSEDAEYLGSLNITINKDFISQYAVENKIFIYSYEDYIRYSVTYSTNTYIDENTDEIIMADIRVEHELSDVVVERYDLAGNIITDNTTLVASIKISNLKLYDTFDLLSKGREIFEDAKNRHYAFNFYKLKDTTSALDSEYIEATLEYKHTETVSVEFSTDRKVEVIYSIPRATLNIIYSLDDVGIYDARELLITSENAEFTYDSVMGNRYFVNLGENLISAEINIAINLNDVAFGYAFNGYSIKTEYKDISNTIEDSINFTVESDTIYNVTMLFTVIQYELKIDIYDESANLNNPEESITQELNVNNKKLSFNKKIGYYISKVRSTTGEEISIAETNEYRLNEEPFVYNYEFTYNDFINFMTNYSIDGADENNRVVELKMYYSIYLYEVTINLSINNIKNIEQEKDNYPLISATYGVKNILLFDETMEANKVVFKKVPYGENLNISVSYADSYGLQYIGWHKDNNNHITTNNKDNLTISSVVVDREFTYEMMYIGYIINIATVKGGYAEAYLGVGATTSTKSVSQFDYLTIKMTANIGYKYRNLYTLYNHESITTFEELKNNNQLFIKNDNGKYILINSNTIYDNTKTYFKKLDVNVGQVSYTYVDELFEIQDYNFTTEGSNNNLRYYLTFYLDFEERLFDINQKYSTEGGTLSNKQIDISLDDVAGYVYYVNGEKLNNGGKIKIGDKVEVKIYINNNALEKYSGLNYDLSRGIVINKNVDVQGVTTLCTGEGSEYSFSFVVNEEIILNVKTNDIITISCKYTVQKFELSVTTNVTTSNFYQEKLLSMNNSEYGFIINNYNNIKNESTVFKALQYLASTEFAYKFSEDYSKYFKINTFKVYLNNEILSPTSTEYANMVRASYDSEDNTKLSKVVILRAIGNVRVEFQVQPIIEVKTNNGYIELMNGSYEFIKTFKCDNKGTGISQEITLGGTDSGADIVASNLVCDAIEIEYYLDGYKCLTMPTNVGTYTIKMSFNTDDKDYVWLNEFTDKFNSVITLTITPKNVVVGYDKTLVKQVEKTYDAETSYNMKDIWNYLVLSFEDDDKNVVNMKYSSDNAFSFNMTKAKANIESKDYSAVEYYSLIVSNLELDKSNAYNRNFLCANNSIEITEFIKINRKTLIVEGLTVYDKVDDNSTLTHINKNSQYKIYGIISKNGKTEDVKLDLDKIVANFTNTTIDKNKDVTISCDSALAGNDFRNYTIETFTQVSTAGIYPYSLSVTLPNGNVATIKNERGLTNPNKARLIPIDAVLNADEINRNNETYQEIYKYFSAYLDRTNDFSVGYRMYFNVNGEEVAINDDLYLYIPKISNLSNVIYLSGEKSGKMEYTNKDNILTIDLSQIGGDFEYIIFVEAREIMALWQIILITILCIVAVALAITVFIIVRVRKKREYSVNDKI